MKKWLSRRWWVCLWAIIMCTILIVWLIIYQPQDVSWVGVAIGLFQLIIGGYIAADTASKFNDGN